jgi:hypothetical protein
MARILGGGVFGQLSGKMGGLVFARNRGGNYVRSFVKPIDPMTIAQLNARVNFGNSSNNYHSLDPSLKTAWKEFALNSFNPKSGVQGTASGFNAFTALLNTTKNINNLASQSLTMGATPITGTLSNFLFSSIPPAFALQTNIKTSTGGVVTLDSIDFSNPIVSNSAGVYHLETNLTINLSGIGAIPAGVISAFEDTNDNLFGFNIYMSNPVAQPGMFIQNPNLTLLGSIQGQASITTPVPVSPSLIYTLTQNLVASNYHSLPQVNEFVQITVYQVGVAGMQNKLGSMFVQVEAP